MKVYVVDLHDADVKVFHGDKLVGQSPGYALVRPTSVQVGSTAFEQARLHPRQVNNQFWQRLSTDPISQSSTAARHYADLAYSHLQHLGQHFEMPAAVVFAVPSSFTSEQLSLLTGIAQACSFRVAGLVDSAVAVAASSASNTEQSLVLDMQLHRTDITVLAAKSHEQNALVQRERIESVNIGLVKLNDKWIQLIADAFIEQCRFDPLHNAATEQALLLKLPNWLTAISKSEEVVLDIESSGQRFQARLQTAQAVEQVTPLYRQLIAALEQACADISQTTIFVSEQVSNLPGFSECLPAHRVISDNAISQGCTQHFDFICGENDSSEPDSQNNTLRFVTALPVKVSKLSPQEVERSDKTESVSLVAPSEAQPFIATHALNGHSLYALEQPLYIGEFSSKAGLQLGYSAHQFSSLFCAIVREPAGLQLRVLNGSRVYVNGQPVPANQMLEVADEITFESSDLVIQMIGEVTDGSQA